MKTTFSEYIKYKFHNTLSRGTPALLSWLGIITIGFIALASIFVKVTVEGKKLSLINIIWISLTRVLDPGVIGGDTGSWPYLVVMLFITMVGVFIFSTLIGIVTTSINNSIQSLRKGRSKIFEENHTLILGWGEKVIAIVTELVIAFNQYQSEYSIVILGDEDKVKMEDKIRDKVGVTGNTTVICRSGISSEIGDLNLTNLNKAKSIIIVPPDEPYADIGVIKTVLALLNYPDTKKEHNMVSVANYSEDYTLLKRIAGDQINVILSNEVVAKIISQTCRQPGLSLVYSEILSFNGKSHYKDITGPWYEEASGDEIYFSNQSEIIGKRYDKAQLSYNSSSVIGIFNSEKGVILNPHSDYLLKEGDQVIVIAQDADKIDYLLNDDSIIDENLIVNKKSYLEPEKILIINSNRLTSLIITKLDKYVIDGSSIDLFNHNNEQLEKEKMNINNLENASINFMSGDPTVYNELEKINLMQYDHIVVLSDFINHGAMNADARNLITLLHARDILRKSDRKITIVSQMMDERNRAVADQARADDFIISEKLISQYMAQISENQFLFPLFNELFTNEGEEIYFNNIKDYVKIGVKTNFYTLVKAASLRNESAIGYRKSALHYDAGENYGVKMNPDKDEEILIDSDDQLIIIASASR
tara:strand:+ start:954 stop:2894 length:1941 start_codon:yes stop_codon:yes gene_type:complete